MLAPDDELGAALHLARLSTSAPAQAPAAYVAALFDEYADRFDQHLTQALAYDGPAQLRAVMDRVAQRKYRLTMDLGCGTGLAAEAFSDKAQAIVGVDLSPQMLSLARAKNLYRRLELGDAVAFLRAEPPACADLILAADLAPYIGDLAPLLGAVARALETGGVFAFTAQAGVESFALGEDLRFAHAPEYIRAVAQQAGLTPIALEHATFRRDRDTPVPGLLIALSLHA